MNRQTTQENTRLNMQSNRRRAHIEEFQEIHNNVDNNIINNNQRTDYIVYLRNNNNFRNQNNQIQSYSNNENNDRIVNSANDDTSTHRYYISESGSRRGGEGAFFCCIAFLIYIILSIGSIIIFYGVTKKIPFFTVFGIFDFIIFVFCLTFLIFNDKIILFKVDSSFFFFIYFLCIDVIMFLFSSYFSIIEYCSYLIIIDQKKIGVIIIFFNIIMGGLGTLIFGLSKICEKKLTIWIRIRDIIFGIIQLYGFILLLYCMFLLPLEKDNYSKIITLLIFGGLSYCFSLYSGISICIELNK